MDRHTHVRMYICSGYGDRHTHVRMYIRSGYGDRHTLCRHIAWYIAHTHKQTLSCFNWEHVCTRRFLICAIQATEYVLSRTTDTYHSCATKCHTHHTTSHPIPSHPSTCGVQLRCNYYMIHTHTFIRSLSILASSALHSWSNLYTPLRDKYMHSSFTVLPLSSPPLLSLLLLLHPSPPLPSPAHWSLLYQ